MKPVFIRIFICTLGTHTHVRLAQFGQHGAVLWCGVKTGASPLCKSGTSRFHQTFESDIKVPTRTDAFLTWIIIIVDDGGCRLDQSDGDDLFHTEPDTLFLYGQL